MSFPHRSDFTSVNPGSAWFALLGAAARAIDGQMSTTPLIIQMRGWDILYKLWRRMQPSEPQWTQWTVHVLNEMDAQLAMIENGPIDPSLAIHADLAAIAAGGMHPNVQMNARVLQCAIWLALSLDTQTGDNVSSPNDVMIPDHAIRPFYVTPAAAPYTPFEGFAAAPFRATWYARTDAPGYPIDLYSRLSR